MPFAPPETRASAWSATDYQTRFVELRSEYAEAVAHQATDNERAALTSLRDEVDQIDVEYRIVLMQAERETRMANLGVGGNGLNAAFMDALGAEVRSWGDQVTENAEFREWMTSNAGRAHIAGPSPDVELRTLVTEAAGSASGSNFLLPVGQPFLGNVNRRRLFIRDLIAPGQTGLSSVPYVKELNAVSNESTASTVAEGATKPEAAIQFVGANAPTSVIAASIPVTTQVMEDAPTVVSYINGRLVYMLKLREENEILTGNGVVPDLLGIRNQVGLQTQGATSGETAITIGNAIAKIAVVNGFPNGVAMNPVDSWAMKIKRASSGAGTFDAGTPFSSVPDMVWGLPVVETNSMPSGKALVGDYALGAQLFDRKQATVRVFEQHSDFAVKNQVLILAEERLALAVYRPDWFVEATIA